MTEQEIRTDERKKVIEELSEAWRKQCKAKWNIEANNNLPKWIREIFGIEKIKPVHVAFAIRGR